AASIAVHDLAEQSSKEAKPADLLQQSLLVDQALKKARDGNRKFLESFSKAQKSGMKDLLKRMDKADSELADDARGLPTPTADPVPDNKQIANVAASLDKALDNFSDAQLSLGRDMGIQLPSANEEVALQIPAVSTPLSAAGQPVAITT